MFFWPFLISILIFSLKLLFYIFITLLILLACVFSLLFLGIKYGVKYGKKEEKRVGKLKERWLQEDIRCTVTLTKVGKDKVLIIKTFKEYFDWPLSGAFEKVEMPLPAIMSLDMPLSLAKELKEKLERVDTIIEIS